MSGRSDRRGVEELLRYTRITEVTAAKAGEEIAALLEPFSLRWENAA